MPIQVTNLDGGRSVHITKDKVSGEFNIKHEGANDPSPLSRVGAEMTRSDILTPYKKLLPIMDSSFNEPPLHFPLSERSEYYNLFANILPAEFQKSLDKVMEENKARWSISGYLENRATLLKNYSQLTAEGRHYHLGIDINAPCGTRLFAPFACDVVISNYEEGEGKYGGVVVLKSQRSVDGQPFYLLFGHLNPDKLPRTGTRIKQGEPFAQIGDVSQNGNWWFHTHLQVLTQRAFDEGWVSKGYCKESEIVALDEFCPNPFLFL